MHSEISNCLGAALENLPIGVVVHDPVANVLTSNKAARELFGLSEGQMQGKNAIDSGWYFVRENSEKLNEKDHPAAKVVKTKKSVTNHIIGIHQGDNKLIKWANVSASPIFAEEGRLERVIVNYVSITERKHIEESLQESEEKLHTLFGAMTEMVVLHDLVFDDTNGQAINYRIIDCNKAYSDITGIKKEDAIGKLATEAYNADSPPYFDEFKNVAITGNPYEYVTYFPPMDKHFMISVVSPKKNRFATITTDITSIKQIEEVLSAKNRELENYLYVASHDFRSPMVNIQGFSQRLNKHAESIKNIVSKCTLPPEASAQLDKVIDEEIPKTLNFISTNVSKMDRLINGLLQISRTGRVRMNIQKIDTTDLVKKVIAGHNFQIEECGGHVEVKNLPHCFGDIDLLNQLFSNLVDNAIKYRSSNCPLKIEISGEKAYNKVILKFADTGIGIAARHIEKIWDVFFRTNDQSDIPGEGIGLSLAKRIADKHKGKITVKSKEGQGSVFSVELNRTIFTE